MTVLLTSGRMGALAKFDFRIGSPNGRHRDETPWNRWIGDGFDSISPT